MIRRMLVGTLVVAGIITILVSLALYAEWNRAGGQLPLERLRFFLDVYKAIGAGFLIALLGAIIPQVLPEARDRFERFKDSRVAYSQAKTSVIYLPEKLSCLPFPDAVSALQVAHERLHLAETFTEQLLGHLTWHPHPETWVDRNYWELMAARRALLSNAETWSSMSTGQRLNAVHEALALVENVFGPDGARWSQRERAVREGEMEEQIESIGRRQAEGLAAGSDAA